MNQTSVLYDKIEKYAKEHHLKNTLLALPIAEKYIKNIMRRYIINEQKGTSNLNHCLEATQMLIDHHIPLDQDEEDILLSSMLCHDLLEVVHFPNQGQELVDEYHLDPRVFEVVQLLTRPTPMTDQTLTLYYNNIKNHKIAVLVALADRGNLVEALSGLSISEANSFVREMRTYLLPICVYAKEYYHDIALPLHIMIEKIRCLIDVTEIISNRYQKREVAYTNEILSITEENARLRGMIHQLKNNQ